MITLETQEIVHTIEQLQNAFEELTVRGLRSAGSEQLKKLESLKEEMERIGAAHMAHRIEVVIEGIQKDDRKAAAALMRAQATLRVFERVLTLETIDGIFSRICAGEDAGCGDDDNSDEDDEPGDDEDESEDEDDDE